MFQKDARNQSRVKPFARKRIEGENSQRKDDEESTDDEMIQDDDGGQCSSLKISFDVQGSNVAASKNFYRSFQTKFLNIVQ